VGHRQGFDLQLTQYADRGWRATFYTTTAWERTPWRATRRAAWKAWTAQTANSSGSFSFF
jgi:hypothetical protein